MTSLKVAATIEIPISRWYCNKYLPMIIPSSYLWVCVYASQRVVIMVRRRVGNL
jgi:hypothetical protein